MGIEDHPNISEMLIADAVGLAPEDPIMIVQKIMHVLSIYPRLSPSMLQIGVGTGLKPAVWKPILEQLVEEKRLIRKFIQAETPSDRVQSYGIIYINPDNPE